MSLINFSQLPGWAQTLASILPLSALIEFVDVETSIHVYQLRGGSVPYWNWPLSPAGARALLSNEAQTGECYLDQPHRSKRLTCIDGRYGNQYPCSAPTTTRLWADTQEFNEEVNNPSPNMDDPDKREQVLQVVQIRNANGGGGPGAKHPIFSDWIFPHLSKRGPRYLIISLTGWFFWTSLLVISLMGELYVAASYLLIMPLTGTVLGFTHGTKPRKPVIRRAERFPRLVIAAGSENPSFWYAFEGYQTLLNGLLNVSLTRSETLTYRKLSLICLRIFILGQWAMALASSALENWDAFIISFWIMFCILASSYGYPVDVGAKGWLKRDCRFRVHTIKAVLSSRYALLFALAIINPDTQLDRTKWMDPIIAKTVERDEIWSSMIRYSNGEEERDRRDNWWWKYVEEGVTVGQMVKGRLQGYPTV